MLLGSGTALCGIIEGILDLSRIEADQLEVVDAPFDPAELVDRCVALFAPLAVVRKLTLVAEHEPDRPRMVGDARRVRQIVLNLLDNALKFTESGTVTVRAATSRPPTGARLSIAITDTGVGIAPETMARLFQPFAQGDATSTRRFGGSGLGLVVSERLAHRMGGVLKVTSTPGAGSTFTLEVPVRLAEVFQAPLPSAPMPENPGSPCRVLVAEDNLVNMAVVVAMLEQIGCEVDTATNGQEAVEAAARGAYDLVLMDCMMPVLDGVEAARRIRAAESPTRRVPIVALTANALAEQRDEALAAGMDDFLTKPILSSALHAVVARARQSAP